MPGRDMPHDRRTDPFPIRALVNAHSARKHGQRFMDVYHLHRLAFREIIIRI